jgi:phytoene dehydrogenase-like protein
MRRMREYDAVIVGSGPNGLAAAVRLAQHGCRVLVLEASDTPGGGVRSAELTLPGFVHDVCSAIHPLGVGSPYFRSLPLEQHGLEWVHPPSPAAHPFDDGPAALLERSVAETAAGLGDDAAAYRSLFEPLVPDWDALSRLLLRPLRLPLHPVGLARFGLPALRSCTGLARSRFRGERARGLFAGVAAHSILPLEWMPSASFGLVLSIAGHAVGWPMPRGGAGRLADALVSYLKSLGGSVETGVRVDRLEALPTARAVLLDLTPREVLRVAGDRLPERFRRGLEGYRYGPGAFKMDWALHGPIPWRAPECARAGTVHLGGTLDELAASERAAWAGEVCERPFVLVAQQSLFDETRVPIGKQSAWAYCHVPHGCEVDYTGIIEAQMERFAPGFRDRILARHATSPAAMEARNPNLVGGDVNGGAATFGQLFARPMLRLIPYATPVPDVYLCSAGTPPGGGVHGMCGYYAAEIVLRRSLRGRVSRDR